MRFQQTFRPPLKALSLMVLVGSLAIACESPPPTPEAAPKSQSALEAMQKLRTGDLKGAVKDYSTVIAQNPEDADSYINRGIAQNELGQNQQAIADYTKALELQPDQLLAYYNRANVYHQLKQYKEAIADYTHIIDLDPNYAYAYANRGATYFQMDKRQEAIADLEQAVEIFSSKNDPKNVERLQRQLQQWKVPSTAKQ
jgi:tetratricopeptide (TPR) repeat protein